MGWVDVRRVCNWLTLRNGFPVRVQLRNAVLILLCYILVGAALWCVSWMNSRRRSAQPFLPMAENEAHDMPLLKGTSA